MLLIFHYTNLCLIITALAYKNIDYDYEPVHLIKDGGEQVSQNAYKLLTTFVFCFDTFFSANLLVELII